MVTRVLFWGLVVAAGSALAFVPRSWVAVQVCWFVACVAWAVEALGADRVS